jgi:hypothetical protein
VNWLVFDEADKMVWSFWSPASASRQHSSDCVVFQVLDRYSTIDFFMKCLEIKKALQQASPHHRQLMLSNAFDETMSIAMEFMREDFLFLQVGGANRAVPTTSVLGNGVASSRQGPTSEWSEGFAYILSLTPNLYFPFFRWAIY